jgi:hypothetical protein
MYSVLPWQRLVLSVALERAGRRPAYRDVLVSVPRQSGKSSMALALMVWRLLLAPDQLVLYSAQNRAAARRKLLHTWAAAGPHPPGGPVQAVPWVRRQDAVVRQRVAAGAAERDRERRPRGDH